MFKELIALPFIGTTQEVSATIPRQASESTKSHKALVDPRNTFSETFPSVPRGGDKILDCASVSFWIGIITPILISYYFRKC